MDLKEFGKFLKGKSFAKTLHRARRESMERILANQEEIDRLFSTPKNKSQMKTESHSE